MLRKERIKFNQRTSPLWALYSGNGDAACKGDATDNIDAGDRELPSACNTGATGDTSRGAGAACGRGDEAASDAAAEGGACHRNTMKDRYRLLGLVGKASAGPVIW